MTHRMMKVNGLGSTVMTMFGKKTRKITALTKTVEALDYQLSEQARDAWVREDALRQEIEALEQTNQPAHDMNVLFGAIQDYRNVMKRLCAPDPIAERPLLRHIFGKYNVKWN